MDYPPNDIASEGMESKLDIDTDFSERIVPLLARAKQGDKEAESAALEALKPRIMAQVAGIKAGFRNYSYASRINTEECVNEAIWAIYTVAIPKIDLTRPVCEMKAYINSVIRNTLLNKIRVERRYHTNVPMPYEDREDASDRPRPHAELRTKIAQAKALANEWMTSQSYEAFCALIDNPGQSLDVVAEREGLEYERFKKRVWRMREVLRNDPELSQMFNDILGASHDSNEHGRHRSYAWASTGKGTFER